MKVSVLVNGNPIPFDMKIGEAGEAFFVFETEDEVPDELITSPILKPQEDGDESPKLDGKADPPFLNLDGEKDPDSRQPAQLESDEQRQQDERADAALDKFRKESDRTPNVTFTNSTHSVCPTTWLTPLQPWRTMLKATTRKTHMTASVPLQQMMKNSNTTVCSLFAGLTAGLMSTSGPRKLERGCVPVLFTIFHT